MRKAEQSASGVAQGRPFPGAGKIRRKGRDLSICRPMKAGSFTII
ncbi:Hypothetical protein RAK1035_1729 [Roseovarius sp. AK1035]|nr:Hypothetical protein RAK1035_1729 [Roseovarius sp. AK1035]